MVSSLVHKQAKFYRQGNDIWLCCSHSFWLPKLVIALPRWKDVLFWLQNTQDESMGDPIAFLFCDGDLPLQMCDPSGDTSLEQGPDTSLQFQKSTSNTLFQSHGEEKKKKKQVKKKIGLIHLLPGCFGKDHFLLMLQSEVLKTTVPCRTEALDNTRTSAHLKTLLLLAEEHAAPSRSAESCS